MDGILVMIHALAEMVENVNQFLTDETKDKIQPWESITLDELESSLQLVFLMFLRSARSNCSSHLLD